MKIFKHLFTALLLLFSVAVNAHDFEVNGIYYNITDEANKTVEVSCQGIVYDDYANEYTGNVEIPESVTYNGKTYSVTKIHWAAFKDCSELTRIIIPRTITVIESQAFENCYALKTVINYSGLTLVKGSTDNGRLAFYAENVINTSNPIIDGDFMFDKLNGVNILLVYLGDDTNITLPQNCNGESYIIGEKAFLYNKTLVSVTIPNKVTSIGSSAFKGCSALKSMTIPNSVTSIGASAFSGCTGLASIEIPNSVTSIGASAFSGCTSLASIEIPNSVTSIGDSAFDGCSGLTSITIGNAVTSIGASAFKGCSALKSITIPGSVTSIGDCAFNGCSSLKDLRIEDGKSTLSLGYAGSYGDGLFKECQLKTLYLGRNLSYNTEYSHGYSPFADIGTLTSVTIGNSVTNIGNRAFYNCGDLASIVIPNSVTSIGNSAFHLCYDIVAVYISDISAWCNINFKDEKSNPLSISLSSRDNLYLNNELVTDLVIPDGVTKIKKYAFSGYSKLTSVTIPNSVTSIEENVFEECPKLTTVHICDLAAWCNINFSSSDANPLYYVKNLYLNGDLVTELVIPNGVTKIKDYAFSGCSGLTSIEIPNSVTSIGSSAFYGCSGITSIEIPNSVTSIGSSAFYGCSGITSIEIPNSVTSIGDSAFDDCSGLTSITIGNAVTSIGVSAFSGCTGLASVEIPNSVTSIGDSAFSGCSGLTSITIGNAVTSIGASAFSGCTGLASVKIPNSVTNIGDSAFSGCSGLTSITIGNAVTSIGASAFSGCTGLASVEIPNSVKSIGNNSFENCSNLETLYIGSAIESIGDNAFVGCNDIYKIIMGSKKAIEANENIFTDDVYYNASLYVLKDRIYAFENRAPWNKFHIVENSFTVTFKVDGEIYKSYTLEYGTAIPVETPAKKGYTFSGWNELPATMPADDITVEGTFSVNTYVITYLVDGEVFATDSIAYGSEVVLIEEPTKEGYTFSGWSEVPETMPAEDITVEGTFIEDTTTGINQVMIDRGQVVIYDLNGLRIIDVHELKRGVYIINGRKVVK